MVWTRYDPHQELYDLSSTVFHLPYWKNDSHDIAPPPEVLADNNPCRTS
jgi:hypothetical protein